MFWFPLFAWLARIVDRLRLFVGDVAHRITWIFGWMMYWVVLPPCQLLRFLVVSVVGFLLECVLRIVGSVSAVTVDSAWWAGVANLFRRAFETLVGGWWRFVGYIGQSRALRWIGLPFQWSWLAWHLLRDYLLAWLATRNFRLLIPSLPVLLLGIVSLCFLVSMPFYTRQRKASRYREAAFLASQIHEDATAELYFRKLTQLGELRPDDAYMAAVEESKKGNWDEAYRRMAELAPEDQPGYGYAHRWIAMTLAARKLSIPAEEARTLSRKHLEFAVELMPDDPISIQWLAEIQFSAKQIEAAMSLLDRLAKLELSVSNRARLAANYQRWGKTGPARATAKKALDEFAREQSKGKAQSLEDLILCSGCCEIAGEYPQAMEFLRLAVETESAPASLREKATTLAMRFLSHPQETRISAEDWLKVASSALRISPANEQLQLLIAGLLVDPAIGNRVENLLRGLAAENQLSPLTLMRIADANVATQKNDRAKSDYAAILKVDASNYRAANNLAWLLATTDPVDLTEAVRVADAAVLSKPDEAYIRDTRGQIHFKLGNWAAAAADFQLALNGLPDYLPIHEYLSDCYDRLGQKELAMVHRQRASLLRQAADR